MNPLMAALPIPKYDPFLELHDSDGKRIAVVYHAITMVEDTPDRSGAIITLSAFRTQCGFDVREGYEEVMEAIRKKMNPQFELLGNLQSGVSFDLDGLQKQMQEEQDG